MSLGALLMFVMVGFIFVLVAILALIAYMELSGRLIYRLEHHIKKGRGIGSG